VTPVTTPATHFVVGGLHLTFQQSVAEASTSGIAAFVSLTEDRFTSKAVGAVIEAAAASFIPGDGIWFGVVDGARIASTSVMAGDVNPVTAVLALDPNIEGHGRSCCGENRGGCDKSG